MTWSAHFHLYLHFYWQHVGLLLKIHLLILHTHTHTRAGWLAGRHNGAYGQRQCLAKCGSSWGSTRSFNFFCSHQSPTPLSAPPLPPSLCRFWPSAAATFSCTFFEHLSGCGSHLPLSSLSLSSSQRPLTSFQLSVHSLSMCLIFFFEAFEMYFDPHSHKSPDGLAKILWVHLISYSTPFPCGALRAKCRLNKQFSKEQRMRSKSAERVNNNSKQIKEMIVIIRLLYYKVIQIPLQICF